MQTIRMAERVNIDRDRLFLLVRNLGEAGAERVVDRALEEVSCRLVATEEGWQNGDLPCVARAAQSLIAIADQVGMHLLAHVSCDVAALAKGDDAPALAAAVARLQRVGESSLAALWGLEDIRV
ncbi:MAG: hypothetical protein AAF871_05870 [Pseudomonadota bacterium]